MAKISDTKKEAILKDLKARKIGVQKIAEKYDVTVYTVKKMKAEMLGKPIPKPTPHLEPKKPVEKVPEPPIIELTEDDLEYPWDKCDNSSDDIISTKALWILLTMAIVITIVVFGILFW